MIWRAIHNWPYDVSDTGQIRNRRTNRLLTPMRCGPKRKQYSVVSLCNGGIQKRCKVHVLVLEAFISPRPQGLYGLHKNDDTTNNTCLNLYWGTIRQNAEDCAPKQQKLTKTQALDIVKRRTLGETGRALARQYGISEQRVCDLYKGRSGTYGV